VLRASFKREHNNMPLRRQRFDCEIQKAVNHCVGALAFIGFSSSLFSILQCEAAQGQSCGRSGNMGVKVDMLILLI